MIAELDNRPIDKGEVLPSLLIYIVGIVLVSEFGKISKTVLSSRLEQTME